MTKLIVKLFIKDYQNISNEKVRTRYGVVAGAIGIVSNVILVVIKFMIGLIVSSIAIIADAINNLSDALSAIITIVGFRLSQKKPDAEHPFGHERIEYICSLIISMIMILVGGNFLLTSVQRIFNHDQNTKASAITLIVLGISILIKVWQSIFYHKMGKMINSTAIKANSRDSLNDSISTLAVLVSAVILYFFNVNIDAYIGALVSVFVIYSGVKLVLESAKPLIGELPCKEVVDELLDILLESEKILGYHDLIFHSYGPNRLISSIHLEFDYREDILMIHEIIDQLEGAVYDKMHIELVVHMDPIIMDDDEIIEARIQIKDKIREYDKKINIHDFRIVKGPTTKKILFDCELPVEYYDQKDDIKKDIQKMVEMMYEDSECIVVLDTKVLYH